jgi:hypothetical protein
MTKKTTIVIHPASKTYLEYGSFLARDEGTILEVNGHLMGFEAGKKAEVELARWRTEAANCPGAFDISLGEHVSRSTDMNPHGLM